MRYSRVLCAVAAILSSATLAAAQQQGSAPKGGKPGGVVVDVVEWSGTVTGVDYTKRTVTLQGPGGRVATVNAQNARNLD